MRNRPSRWFFEDEAAPDWPGSPKDASIAAFASRPRLLLLPPEILLFFYGGAEKDVKTLLPRKEIHSRGGIKCRTHIYNLNGTNKVCIIYSMFQESELPQEPSVHVLTLQTGCIYLRLRNRDNEVQAALKLYLRERNQKFDSLVSSFSTFDSCTPTDSKRCLGCTFPPVAKFLRPQ